MNEIKIHNTLSGRLDMLQPAAAGALGIYACGPTVYSRIHIGNARPYVIFALLKRFLQQQGYEVKLVYNITDINDKIYEASREKGVPSVQLAEEMTTAYIADTDRLGLGRPDSEPKATESIDSIVGLIELLVERGAAYEAAGSVYFRVRAFKGYGSLSNRKIEDMASQEVGEGKKDALDFALWKATKDDEDTSWGSPWGPGRPGWHIECSAMAEQELGLGFAIHGGGSDLIFPHHENEIAQSSAAHGKELARIWMHNGMVRSGEEKMAKSVGNIELLGDLLDHYSPETLIIFLISGHYRQPLIFSKQQLTESQTSLNRIREFCRALSKQPASKKQDRSWSAGYQEDFYAALANDFNTPQALAALFSLVADGNKRLEAGSELGEVGKAVEEMLWCIGLDSLLESAGPTVDSAAEELLEQREAARRSGDFATADDIRERLAAIGYEVRDLPEGAELVPKE